MRDVDALKSQLISSGLMMRLHAPAQTMKGIETAVQQLRLMLRNSGKRWESSIPEVVLMLDKPGDSSNARQLDRREVDWQQQQQQHDDGYLPTRDDGRRGGSGPQRPDERRPLPPQQQREREQADRAWRDELERREARARWERVAFPRRDRDDEGQYNEAARPTRGASRQGSEPRQQQAQYEPRKERDPAPQDQQQQATLAAAGPAAAPPAPPNAAPAPTPVPAQAAANQAAQQPVQQQPVGTKPMAPQLPVEQQQQPVGTKPVAPQVPVEQQHPAAQQQQQVAASQPEQQQQPAAQAAASQPEQQQQQTVDASDTAPAPPPV
jgi:hypothetical protein